MPDDLWAAFTVAGFTCWAPDPITVRPSPKGTRDGPFPFAGEVAFVTADNPRGEVASEAVNAVRRAALADALDDLGLTWLAAVGGRPDDVHHRELGAVVIGLGFAAAAGLGARFGQAAVYVWASDALHLVACSLDRHEVLGYTAVPGPPQPPPRLRAQAR